MTKLCIDIGCGLGGFSDAFKLDPEWEVIGIDIEKKFKPTICADVRYIPLKQGLKPDCLVMSPPCEKFSLMNNFFPKPGIKTALEVVGACLELVSYLLPKKWLLENPKGRLRWFIGIPRTSIRYSDYDLTYKVQKPTDLWGNIDLPFAKMHRPIRTKRSGKHMMNFYKCYSGTAATRAKIPFGVSQAVKQGVEAML
jgi:hypothetical protein